MRFRTAIASLWLLLAASGAAADYRGAYLDGLRAVEEEDWPAVEGRMREAIAERPEELARARLVGVIPQPYLPHLWLGRARYEQGDCAEALAAWQRSERSAALPADHPLVIDRAERQRQCRDRLAAKVAAQPVAPAAAGETAPEQFSESTRQPPKLDPDSAGGVEPEPDSEMADQAASKPAEEVRQPVTEAPVRVDPARPALPEAAPGDLATEEPIAIAREHPGASEEAAVRAAAAAYSDGHFEAAVIAIGTSPTSLAGSALRAASLFALWRLSGERDADLLRDARRAVARCRELAPEFRPSAEHFPPAFVALFER